MILSSVSFAFMGILLRKRRCETFVLTNFCLLAKGSLCCSVAACSPSISDTRLGMLTFYPYLAARFPFRYRLGKGGKGGKGALTNRLRTFKIKELCQGTVFNSASEVPLLMIADEVLHNLQ